MSAYASVNGDRIARGSVTLPLYGAWCADVVLANTGALDGLVTVQLGDLTLHGTAIRQANFAGALGVRIVGGAGGWRQRVAQKSYQSTSGIRRSLILGDVAREVGETVKVSNDISVGSAYVREAAPAERVLRQLVGRNWWIDDDGSTLVGATRDASPIKSEFTVIDRQGGKGRLPIATETLDDWTPGRTFSAPTVPDALTISSVTHTITNDGTLRLDVLTGVSQDRIAQYLLDIIRAEFPAATYAGVWEYIVQDTDGSVVSASPSDTSIPLPDLVDVPLRANPIGGVTPAVGSTCLVAFINADPTRPIILSTTPGVDVASIVSGGMVATEHLLTTEAAVNLFINFLYFIHDRGNPSTWASAGNIFDVTTFPTQLVLSISEWLGVAPTPAGGAASPTPPTAVLGGGVLLPSTLAVIDAALTAKLPNVTRLLPFIGCPEVKSG